MIKYFHELTNEEFGKLCKTKPQTWEEFSKDYPQPKWCSYPNAVCGVMGCWSLMGHLVTGRNYCKKCDLYIPKKKVTSTGATA
jgi:hypothetical protein